jgi:hypothetical protein
MERKTTRGMTDLARLPRDGNTGGSLLTLIGLDMVAFAAAAALALMVPDALDAAASSANESAFGFRVPERGLPAADVVDANGCLKAAT